MRTADKINIYVDMDGVQAMYGFGDSVEEMAAPGYFRDRPVQVNMVEAMKRMQQDERFRVVVLSAVFQDNHSIADKKSWLEKNGLGETEACFVPCGARKADYVGKDGVNILIDDFTKNLLEWEQYGDGFHGIKFLNEQNGSKGRWFQSGGYCVNYHMSAERLYIAITGIADALAAVS